jgi:dTDP-4-amino-4,6-dideoxygalactose transaminase
MQHVNKFETAIAEYYGAKFAVATDCCTHAIELCLRLKQFNNISCPNRTYLSVPMTFMKLGLSWEFTDELWQDYYTIGNTNIIDAAVYWRQYGYIPNTMMCLSFQYRKHLSLGRGGMILLDNHDDYISLKKMSYDGRTDDLPWAKQNVETIGYHYYMTPESANSGLKLLNLVKNLEPRAWSYEDYPDLKSMKVFDASK